VAVREDDHANGALPFNSAAPESGAPDWDGGSPAALASMPKIIVNTPDIFQKP